jgi:hypothetical protein
MNRDAIAAAEQKVADLQAQIDSTEGPQHPSASTEFPPHTHVQPPGRRSATVRFSMRAAWYEQQGPAREVLKISEMADPTPGPGELRIRTVASGINPGDIKKRQDAFDYGMPYRA